MSRNRASRVLMADVVTCVLVLATLAVHRMPSSPSALMLFWGAVGIPGLVYTIVVASQGTVSAERVQTFADTWRLGRWGAMDAGLAAIATLVPMVVSTVFLSMTASGTYRVLQSALGPLNILHSTVLTVLMLDSWQTSTRLGLRALRRKMFRILLGMVSGSVLCLAVALPAMVALSGLRGPDVSRVAIVIGLAGLLGSATTAFNGAALTLGRQHWGVGIRLVTVAIAIAVSVGSGSWVPWQDPIGLSMLASATVVLVGWAIAYTVANRRESVRLLKQPPAQEAAPRVA